MRKNDENEQAKAGEVFAMTTESADSPLPPSSRPARALRRVRISTPRQARQIVEALNVCRSRDVFAGADSIESFLLIEFRCLRDVRGVIGVRLRGSDPDSYRSLHACSELNFSDTGGQFF